jgi:hypothetical protein
VILARPVGVIELASRASSIRFSKRSSNTIQKGCP